MATAAEAAVKAGGEIARAARSLDQRRRLFLTVLGGVLVLVLIAALSIGAVTIGAFEILAILAQPLGLDLGVTFGPREETVLLAIRVPRVVLGLLAGAALAVSGAALQGLFRNPLADPALIGVSMGAALAAVATIVLGGALAASLPAGARHLMLPAAAFAGGLVAVLAVYRIAARDGRTDVATLLLAGIAVNAIAQAGIGYLMFISDDQQLRDLNFWLLAAWAATPGTACSRWCPSWSCRSWRCRSWHATSTSWPWGSERPCTSASTSSGPSG